MQTVDNMSHAKIYTSTSVYMKHMNEGLGLHECMDAIHAYTVL